MASDVEMLVSKNGNGGSAKQQANVAKPAKEKASEAVSSKKIVQYTRDKLFELAAAPLSCKKPKCFSENQKLASLSCLKGGGKPSRQKKGAGGPGGRERSDTPPDEAERRATASSSAAAGAGGGPNEHKKSAADPRERLKAEEDGIVLSPQRRSFTTGCQAPSTKPKEEDAEREIHRELPARRIGSGRIVTRDEARARPGGRFDRFDGRLEKTDHRDRFEEKRGGDRRGGFGRDWLGGPQHGGGGGGGGGGFGREPPQDMRGFQQGNGSGGRRQRNDRRGGRTDEEPEWFSAGPTSQHDMIELHGFNDDGGEEAAEEPPAPPEKPEKRTKQQPAKAPEPAPPPPPPTAGPAAPAPEPQRPSDPPFMDDPAIQSTIQHHRPAPEPAPLDLDDILRWDIDSLPLDAVGGGGGGGAASASIGFSRWFRRESPPPAAAGAPAPPPAAGAGAGAGVERRSSLQDELVGNILNGLEDLSLKIPASEPEVYFAPISPAHGSDKLKGDILSMLQRAPQQTEDTVNLAVKLAAMGGKAHNVADLEAAVRPDMPQPHPQDNQDAFRRLVSQLRASEAPSNRQKAPPPPTDPFSQMLSKAAAPQLVRPAPLQPGEPRPITPASAAGHPPASVTQDNLMKLLHMQQQQQQEHRRREHQQQQQAQQQQLEQAQQQQLEQQQQQMAVHNLQQLLTMQRAASPAPSPLEQLMAIPEARNILIGLQNGRLSRQNLIQQLHNQVLQPRLREIIVAVLRLPQRVSPLPEPLQSALRAPAAQRNPSPFQHLGVAPVPGPHRVPSPQEIRVHTQQILQQALIKRKLEEQKENFRKRQENREKSPLLDGGSSDGDRRRPPNTTPASLAFTPTAVIRNMKAEARGSPEHRPKGRPLVKTNPDGPQPAVMSAGNIQSVAAKLLETQAQLQQQQAQQAQQPWLRTNAATARPPQLAANPLARWFSPEMLASAPRADLPPAVQQRVLSVEELERHQVIN